MAKEGDSKKLSNQEIVEGFRRMREEQRIISAKMAELESDKTEHRLVIETLDEVDGDKKCFRLLGGILVERQVKEVLPTLKTNIEQITKTIEMLNEQLILKGKELNAYREKHNIRIQGEEEKKETKPAPSDSKSQEDSSSGVLLDK